MAPRRLSRTEAAFAIGVPATWAVLLLFHPTGEGEEFYPVVRDEVTPWIVVHVGTLILIPLMGLAVFLLLRGVDGAAALVARTAVASFVLFYAAWETLIGIGTGLLADQVNELTGAQNATGARLVEDFTDSGVIRTFELIGTGSLFVALTGAGVALRRRAHAPLAVPILLVLAAVPTAWHVPPFGQVGLALFVAAAVLVVRRPNGPQPAVAPGGQPTRV